MTRSRTPTRGSVRRAARPPRVLIVSRIFAPEPSAASFFLEAVARQFRDSGCEVTVITTTPPKHLPPSPIPGVKVRRAPVLRDALGYVRGYVPYLSFDLPLAFRLLLRRRADLYFVEPPPTTGAVVRVIAWLLRRPYFYDAADVWADAAALATSSRLVLTLLRRVELFALRGATHIFTISRGVADRMRELQIATPATVAGFGVDPEVFRYQPSPADESAPYFVYAGTYSEWHGADIFVDAFGRFSLRNPGYRLLFIGNGSARPLLENKVAAEGLDAIEFRDPVSGTELNALLNGAVASLASLKPGQGYDYAFTTKIYSSLAAGCPTLFSGVGPVVQFFDDAGTPSYAGRAVRYDAEEVESALADAARHRLSGTQRNELSDWTRSNYSLARIAQAVVTTALNEATTR